MSKRRLPSKARLGATEKVFGKWRRSPSYRNQHAALEDEFAIMSELIEARTKSDFSQAEVAARMMATHSAVGRLEGMGHRASLATLRAYAAANGHRVEIVLEPAES